MSEHAHKAAAIERYLLARGEWCAVDVVCRLFEVTQRSLRSTGGMPGLASGFAISDSKLGLKHVACVSAQEWEECQRRARRHAIGELRRWRTLRLRRERMLASAQPPVALDGQRVFPPVAEGSEVLS